MAPSDYHSFLLRLWQVQEDSGSAWRISLEQVETGTLQGFSSLEDLLVFLRQVISSQTGTVGDGNQNQVQGEGATPAPPDLLL